MAAKLMLVALVALASVSVGSALLLCQCPATNVCSSNQGTCGLPPSISLSFTIPGISRAYGYVAKQSNTADADSCSTFCAGAGGKYFEYVAAGGPTIFGFFRRPAKDCVCYSKCMNSVYWLSSPSVNIVSGFPAACPVPVKK